MLEDEASLIASIYETVGMPDNWSEVLERLASRFNGMGGSLFVVTERGTDWIATSATLEIMHEYDAGRWAERNPRVDRLFAKGHRGFINDLDLFTSEEIARTPIYREFLYPRGIGWAGATFAPAPGGGNIVLSIDRKFCEGPHSREELDQLDRLHGHIVRAAWLGAEVRMDRALHTATVLETLGIAAAMVDRQGRVRRVNATFDALAPSLAVRADGRLALADPRTSERLNAALAGVAAGRFAGLSIPVRANAPLVLHILPVAGRAGDIFAGSSAILVAMSVPDGHPMDPGLLQHLFELTPAEARVAAALAGGADVQEIAAIQRIGVETVRTHVKRLLAKTGNARQTDLIRQLAAIAARSPKR